MSIRSSIRSFVVVALSLVTTSLALARTPPALLQSQQLQGHAAASSGYRDSLARVSAARVPTSRALGTAAGYRDTLTRFAARHTRLQVASSR